MEQSKKHVKEKVWQLIDDIINHGRGNIDIRIGPKGRDITNVLVASGKSYQFQIKRPVED